MSEEIVIDPIEPVIPVEPTEPVIPVEPAEGEWVAVTEDVIQDSVKLGDFEGTVTIPADLANLAGEAGIDISAVASELYASEDFSLSDETKDSLYDKFGKWQVDSYLAGIKAQNDNTLSAHKSQVEEFTAASQKAWDATLEVMGGEDRWDDMADYAQRNLPPDEVEEFNNVMEHGSMRMQQLMIKDMYAKFEVAGKPVLSADSVVLDLEEGDNGKGDVITALTKAEYLALFPTGEYHKDPAKYDKLRQAGINKGI